MSKSFADVPGAAIATAADYLREAQESQGPWSIAWALWCNALAARHAQDFETAREHILQCLRLESELNDRWGITWSVELYAWIMAAMLDTADDARTAAELAAWLLGASSAVREAMGIELSGLAPLAAGRETAEEQIRRHLPQSEYYRPYEAGRRRYADVISVALGEPPPRRPVSPRVAAMTDTRPGLHDLTEREQQVALLVAEELTNADIAAQLRLSPETVKKQVSSIIRKLGVNNRIGITRRILQAQEDQT